MSRAWDVIILGAGAAGIATAITAAARGARILVVEAGSEIGGTLHIAGGRMSGAGTRLQRDNGIEDSPQAHYDDVMRICRGTADPALLRLAVDLAGDTLDWLSDLGFVAAAGCPAFEGHSHDAYLTRRVVWGNEGGRAVLKAIEPSFRAAVTSGSVTLAMETRATRLLVERDGSIAGVCVQGKDGHKQAHRAARTVIATGGFATNAPMIAEIHGLPHYAQGAMPLSMGDGIRLGLQAGGHLRGTNLYHANFGAVIESYDYPSHVVGRVQSNVALRPPWELYVDSSGQRFVREDEPSLDLREQALFALPDQRYWIVFDAAILRDGPPLIERWSREQMTAALGNHPMFLAAGDLESLAEAAGMAPRTFQATVDAYNTTLDGSDPTGRQHRPRPIAEPPFYAVRMHCIATVSTAGLAVDREMRVLDDKDRPIPNLHAVGEVIGSAATMGDAGAFGMLVTPALSFGRLLGGKVLEWEHHRSAAE